MWNTYKPGSQLGILVVYSKENCLMIGNTRWHWACKIKNQWKYFHTSPNSIEFKNKEPSQITWAAVGAIPKTIDLNPARRLSLNDIPLLNVPANLGIDRALSAWSAFQKASYLRNNKEGLLIVDAGTILSITKITNKGEFAGGQLIAGLKLQLSSMAKGALNLEEPSINVIPEKTFQYKTEDAMIKGSINGLVGAIAKAYDETNFPIWICGGDSSIIYKELLNRSINVKYHPNLVLEGMVDILNKSV